MNAAMPQQPQNLDVLLMAPATVRISFVQPGAGLTFKEAFHQTKPEQRPRQRGRLGRGGGAKITLPLLFWLKNIAVCIRNFHI